MNNEANNDLYHQSLKRPLGICSSTVRHFTLPSALAALPLEIISVFDVCAGTNCIIDINNREQTRARLKLIKDHNLSVDTINSYYSIFDEQHIRQLLGIASEHGIKKIRLTLPAVNTDLSDAYHHHLTKIEQDYFPGSNGQFEDSADKIERSQIMMRKLSHLAEAEEVIFLFETHWATIMSSFSSAYHLLSDIQSNRLKLIWDPANMCIEGKEDFDMGLSLIGRWIDTVHVKNVSWRMVDDEYFWDWEEINKGMVKWKQIVRLMKRHHLFERVSFKIEDFTFLKNSSGQVRKKIEAIRELLSGGE
jgi:sugar phosphate isomerase/epimerase